jgi:hypothetical protein
MYFSLTLVLLGESLFFKILEAVGIYVRVRAARSHIRDPIRRTEYGEEVGSCLCAVR